MAYYSNDLLELDHCITIPSLTAQQNFTEYVIQVDIRGVTWTVSRRYSEFDELHQRLITDYGIDKKVLPPKKLIGNTNDTFIHKRRLALERYLQYLLQQFRLLPFQLALFLDFQKYEVCGITHALAELLFTRGESILDREAVCSMDPLQIMSICDRMVKTQSIESVSLKNDMGHILDFTSRLQSLRIIGTQELVGTSNININDLHFSISIFKSLTRLEVYKCNLYKMNGIQQVQSSVKRIKLKKTLSSNGQSFEVLTRGSTVYWEDEEGNEESEHLDGSPTSWPLLTWLDISENQLTTLPQSLSCMSRIEYLDAHDNYLEDLDHLDNLAYLSHLDVSLNRITCLSDLHVRLGNVRTINLRGNKLETLSAFSKLYSLEYLDVSNNCLSQIKEVEAVGKLPLLESLVVTGNPLTVVPDYRIQILCMFGDRANQVTLDNSKAVEKELDTVAVLKALERSRAHSNNSSVPPRAATSSQPPATNGNTFLQPLATDNASQSPGNTFQPPADNSSQPAATSNYVTVASQLTAAGLIDTAPISCCTAASDKSDPKSTSSSEASLPSAAPSDLSNPSIKASDRNSPEISASTTPRTDSSTSNTDIPLILDSTCLPSETSSEIHANCEVINITPSPTIPLTKPSNSESQSTDSVSSTPSTPMARLSQSDGLQHDMSADTPQSSVSHSPASSENSASYRSVSTTTPDSLEVSQSSEYVSPRMSDSETLNANPTHLSDH